MESFEVRMVITRTPSVSEETHAQGHNRRLDTACSFHLVAFIFALELSQPQHVTNVVDGLILGDGSKTLSGVLFSSTLLIPRTWLTPSENPRGKQILSG